MKPATHDLEVLKSQFSVLAVIDIQERLLPSISERDRVLRNTRFLLDSAQILGVRTVFTEQYPKGLGPTVSELTSSSSSAPVLEKLAFSAAEVLQTAGFPNHSGSENSSQIVLAGIETHICVQQTALQLMAAGHSVFIAVDAVSSRNLFDHHIAIERMRHAGAVITTSEAIAFEWCERAGSDQFKALSRLVKERDLLPEGTEALLPGRQTLSADAHIV